MKRYMSAQEVADKLGVSITTVYAYVSRGLLRSEAAGGDPRARRYYGEDVEQLQQRQEQRRHPEKALESALSWGAPLLDSRLTLIAEGRLFYRGLEAIYLAENHSIEDVAALLWTGDLHADVPGLHSESAAAESPRYAGLRSDLQNVSPFERMQTLLPLAALEDSAAYDLRAGSVVHTGAKILHILADAAVGARQTEQGHLVERLQQAWSPEDGESARWIDRALIVCADHELNVSSFTARCVASAGATPYAVVSAGLAALQGARHGGSTERVAALLSEISRADDARTVLVSRLKRGELLPGFGHRLYPEGDPRARLLIDGLTGAYAGSEALALAAEIIGQVRNLTGEPPNVDFGLVVLARALRLPAGAPLALFALGRIVGWIGHALEQYAAGVLIRPRARYVGVQPEI